METTSKKTNDTGSATCNRCTKEVYYLRTEDEPTECPYCGFMLTPPNASDILDDNSIYQINKGD